jgi:hypothetical protein
MRPDLYYNLASDLYQHLCPTCHYSWNTQLKLHHIFRLTRFRQRKWFCNKYSFGLNVCLRWGRQFKHPDVENESDLRHPGHAWEPVVKLPFHMMETGRCKEHFSPNKPGKHNRLFRTCATMTLCILLPLIRSCSITLVIVPSL